MRIGKYGICRSRTESSVQLLTLIRSSFYVQLNSPYSEFYIQYEDDEVIQPVTNAWAQKADRKTPRLATTMMVSYGVTAVPDWTHSIGRLDLKEHHDQGG